MRVCLKELLCVPEVSVEPVLHLFLSVYKSFCTWKCLSSRALLHLYTSVYQSFVLHLCLSAVYKSSVLHLDVFACKSPVYRLNLEEHSLQIFLVCFGYFRNRFVCFSCFDMCSTHRNKPKIIFLVSRKTLTDCVSDLFG
jgi:hypothetical protein